jgi:hypothetical protein
MALASYRPGHMDRAPKPTTGMSMHRLHLEQIDFESSDTWITEEDGRRAQVVLTGAGITCKASEQDIVDVLSMVGLCQRLHFKQCPVVAVPRA